MTISKTTKKQFTAVIGCVGIIAVYWFLMHVSGWIVSLFDIKSSAASMAFREFLYALSALGLMKLLGVRLGTVLFRPLNKRGKPVLILFMIVISIKSAMSFSGVPTQSLAEIILFTLTMLFVGIAEEGVFRGIIAESMIRTFGSSDNGRIKAALISGAMFGMIHIINASSAELSGVLVQCAGAFAIGVFFAMIYYCTGCLALNIFIHAAADWSNLISYGLYGESSVHEIISGYSPTLLIPVGISLIFFILLTGTWHTDPIRKTT